MSGSILVRARLVGLGVGADPYRANLPTYVEIETKVEDGYTIVSVPQDTLGLTDEDLKGEQSFETTRGPLYMNLSADNLAKAQAHLDKAYPGKGHALELVSG